jgi:hypothetical protein
VKDNRVVGQCMEDPMQPVASGPGGSQQQNQIKVQVIVHLLPVLNKVPYTVLLVALKLPGLLQLATLVEQFS